MKNKKRLHPEDVKLIKDEIVKDIQKLIENRSLNRWLLSDEFCEKLGISRSKLVELRNQNMLTFSQIGKRYYYNIDDFEALLEKNKINTFHR